MNREPAAPKPFDYIPFAREVKKAAPAGHQRFDPERYTGFLTGDIVVLTPVHVGSGILELTKRVAPNLAMATPLIKGFVRSGGVRVIPGSTLKGAVRSVVEAITPSTVGKVGRRTRVPAYLQEPGTGRGREANGVDKNKPVEQNPLSPADRMFGVMDYLGQVRFSDARQIGNVVILVEMPTLHKPNTEDEVRGRKFYKHGQPAKGNTPCEAVPEKARFELRCDFDNLRAGELGALLLALGQGEPGLYLKLGSGKPVCYGSVQIDLKQLILRRQIVADYLDWAGTEEAGAPTEFVAAALADPQLILPEQLHELRQTLKYPNERNCPPGIY